MRIQLKTGQIVDIEGASIVTDIDEVPATTAARPGDQWAKEADRQFVGLAPNAAVDCPCQPCDDARQEREENRWHKFRADIAINYSSLENVGSNTSDYMLASFLADVLMALNKLTTARDNWKAQ